MLTLADYRIRHALYKTDPDLQALHAAVPWVITWDDHEVANDQWSGGAENHTPGTEGNFATRVAAARQAYAEWMPVRLGADGRIYRRIRFGKLAELSMLDLRTYRSQQTSGTDVDDPAPYDHRQRPDELAEAGTGRLLGPLEAGRQPGDDLPARCGNAAGLAARPARQAARHPGQRFRRQRRPVGRLQRRPRGAGRSSCGPRAPATWCS